MNASPPRAVIVRRPTDYELLLARHATRGQAAFFLKTRDQDIDMVEDEHRRMHAILDRVAGHVPSRWRRSDVIRGDLDRFLFEPNDVVIAVGQDGLVANIAKYLDGQPVIGVNPLPERYDGVLVRFNEDQAVEIMRRADGPSYVTESRTMVSARIDRTQTICALNELFIGQRTHQSARYRIRWHDRQERHSSSGVIVATGTGASGWARSINLSRADKLELPSPTDRRLAFFVREAFPSVATGTRITTGLFDQTSSIRLTSEMNGGGVVFGDGIEDDYISFDWGQTVEVSVADKTLNLVIR